MATEDERDCPKCGEPLEGDDQDECWGCGWPECGPSEATWTSSGVHVLITRDSLGREVVI